MFFTLIFTVGPLGAQLSNSLASGALLAPRGSVTGLIYPAVVAEDPDGLSKVSLVFVDGGRSFVLCDDSQPGNSCPSTSGSWAGLSVDPTQYDVPGASTLTVGLWVEDDLGWRSPVAQAVVDYLEPTAGGSSGQIRAPNGTFKGDIPVRAQASDPDGVARVELDFGSGTSAVVLCEPCSGEDWSRSNIDPGDFGASPGNLTATLYVTDMAGVTQAVANQDLFWQPASAGQPSGSLESPLGFVDGNIMLSAVAADPEHLDRVTVRFGSSGGVVELCGSSTPCLGFLDSWRLGGIAPQDLGASSGTIQLELDIRDDAGSTSTALQHSFEWRHPADKASSGSIASIAAQGDGIVDIELSARDPDSLEKVTLVFAPGGTPLVVCEDGTSDPCPAGISTASFSEAGVDPRNHGASAGEVKVRLWIEDKTGRKEWVDEETLIYSPPADEGVLAVVPSSHKTSSGEEGGPFSPLGSYVIENSGNADLDYEVDVSFSGGGPWLNVGASSDSLAPAGTATISLSISSVAADLPEGSYTATLSFENSSNGLGDTTRLVTLVVDPASAPPPRIGGRITDSQGAPIEGVRMDGMPVVHWTDANGEYGRVVGEGWSGTIKPSKAGYTFDPPQRFYSDVTSSANDEDYVGELDALGILGRVTAGGGGLAGVTLDGLPGPPVTDVNGDYQASVPFGFTGLAVPSKAGYVFTPPSIAYDDLRGWRTDQNFDAAITNVVVSGEVTRNGSGLSNVWLSGLPGGVTTDSSGQYSALVPLGWSGTVTPQRAGYVFTPSSRIYDGVQGGESGDYSAASSPPGSHRLWIVADDQQMREAGFLNDPGDLVLVEPGTYTDVDIADFEPGVTLLSRGGADVTIFTRDTEHWFNKDDVTADGFTFEVTNSLEPVRVFGDRVRILNSRFRPSAGESSLRISKADDVLVEGCVFDQERGILAEGTSDTVGELVIRNNHFSGLTRGAIGAASNPNMDIRIENNYFGDVDQRTVDLDDFKRVTVHNNIFADLSDRGLTLGGASQQSSVAHNVFYKNDRAIHACDASVLVFNNIFQENSEGIDGCSSATVNVHHNIIWLGRWLFAGPSYIIDEATNWRDERNPRFVDAPNHDFHPGPGSEAVAMASDGTDLGAYGGVLGDDWRPVPGTPSAPPAFLAMRLEGRSELSPGESVSFRAEADFENGFYARLREQASWTSSDPSVLTVLGAGSVQALMPGTSTLTVTWDGHSESVLVTVLGASPVLSVGAAPEPVLPGGTLRYSLAWRNDGPAVARGARLQVVYDARTSNPVVSMPPDEGTADTWTLGDLGVGDTGSLTIDVDVDSGLVEGDLLAFEASFYTDFLGTFVGTASSTVVGRGDLVVTKNCSPTQAFPGDLVTCQLEWRNDGSGTAPGTQLVEAYPSGLSFVSATPSPSSGDNVWDLGAVERNGAGTVEVEMRVADGAIGEVVNQVDIFFDEADLEPADNRATATISVTPRVDLEMVLSADPDPVLAGEVLVWTLSTINHGPSTANGLVVRQDLPPGTDLAGTPVGDGWSCATSGDLQIVCSRPTLDAAESSSIAVPVSVPGQAGVFDSSAEIDAVTAELDPTDNVRQLSVTVLSPVPSTVLLVDDDDQTPDVRGAYTDALDSLGIGFDVWDTGASDAEPNTSLLSNYEVVIWLTGDHTGGAAGPGAASESALAAYLDSGGCLLMSSQDYLFDRGGPNHDVPTPFMVSHLGVAEGESDVRQAVISGEGAVFGGHGPYSLDFPYSNFSDRLSPDATASVAFSGDAGNAGVIKETENYGSTYWGFGLEALPDLAVRAALLEDVLSFCEQVGLLFGDDFEAGDTSRWSATAQE